MKKSFQEIRISLLTGVIFLWVLWPSFTNAALVNIVGFNTGDASTNGEVSSLTGSISAPAATSRSGGAALKVNPTTTAVSAARIGAFATTGAKASFDNSRIYTTFYF